jgi:hypothetical protein
MFVSMTLTRDACTAVNNCMPHENALHGANRPADESSHITITVFVP